MSEQIGKHKGAVETLLHEKKELSRILQIVNSQLERHLSALEEAGVDTDQFIQQIQEGEQKKQESSRKKQKSSQQERRSRSESRSRNRQQSTDNQQEDGQGAGEMLEGEDDFSDRDFSPR